MFISNLVFKPTSIYTYLNIYQSNTIESKLYIVLYFMNLQICLLRVKEEEKK